MKYIKIGLLLFICFFQINVRAIDLTVQSNNAILYHLDTDEVLYEKESNERVSIASLTKIMTALVVVEHVDNLDERVMMNSQDFKGLVEQNAVQAGFQVNEKVTYRDLLYGLLLPSGADAAQALARLVAKDEIHFVTLMNKKAGQLHLKNTHFKNVTGLDSDNHYSTVKEVSILFKEALKNKDLKKIMTTKSYRTSNGRLFLRSTVLKYDSTIPYLQGGKSGTTSKAGLCLASIANLSGTQLLLVTTGAPYDKRGPHHIEDAKVIYDYFQKNYGIQTIIKKDDVILTLKTQYAKEDTIKFYMEKDIKIYLPNDYNKKDIIFKYDGIDVIKPSMKKGKILGTLEVYYKDKKIASKNIILSQKVSFDVIKFINNHRAICVVAIFGILYILFSIKKRIIN